MLSLIWIPPLLYQNSTMSSNGDCYVITAEFEVVVSDSASNKVRKTLKLGGTTAGEKVKIILKGASKVVLEPRPPFEDGSARPRKKMKMRSERKARLQLPRALREHGLSHGLSFARPQQGRGMGRIIICYDESWSTRLKRWKAEEKERDAHL